ncbi:unnamed protein product [Phaedon cochleariae]|uniref:PHD and RING finger domain-containing protein 1 n=1 Tax=Phaedon cochleariae TaxID=80249 RepID=A0A9P0DXL6_PHACE|nr:unnamed protein product [Phaedon cochleariae]
MSSSDESDAGPQHKRKRKSRTVQDSPASTSSGSPIIGGSTSIRRRTLQSRTAVVDSSDTDNSSSPILHRQRRKIVRVSSDSDSSDDSVIRTSRAGKPRQLASDSESELDSQWTSDFSEDETKTQNNSTARPQESNIDSDVSDGQSEKCPICLARFRSQEIGTPESCDHTFCLECIQEWSKNMNTCPVDRQEYNLILVRNTLNGKVCKQIPITKPTPQNDVDIIEDPTYCEICGSCDNEDRMLLCDGCDLGFHLYCLNPPLEDIPIGAWYCNDCSPDDVYTSEIELVEVHLLLDEAQSMDRPTGMRRRESNRLIPRTRQSERVRRQIVNNRQQNSRNSRTQNHSIVNDAAISTENNDQVDAVGSTSSRNRTSRRRRINRRSRQNRTRTVYEIDAITGETVAVQKSENRKRKTRKKKKKKRGDRIPVRPKTVKKRLAQQLGICTPRSDPQHLPDVAIPNPQGRIHEMRFSAGIPNVDLFGNHQGLDYFSDGDEDYSMGNQLLARRAPNHSDVVAVRRAVRRKATISLPETVSSTTDLLDNILSSQEQFLSRNATYSLDPNGKFKIEKKESSKNYVDVRKEKATAKETPYYNNNRNYNNRYQNNRYQNNRYNNRQNYYSNNQNQNYNNSEPSSSMGYPRYSDNRSRDNYDCPQDYTQRTLCASSESEYQENKDKEENTNNRNNESEVDIYSDIETVSTSKVDDDEYGELMKPPTPPELPDIGDMYPNEPHAQNAYADEDNDSEPDMVIDDEKVQEQENNIDDKKEEAAVTSTVDYSNDVEPPSGFFETTHQDNYYAEIQSGAVQSSNLSNLDQIKNYQYDDEEDSTDGCPNSNIYSKETLKSTTEMEEQDSDDGCPNFSIYSKESKTVALHTDISISQKMAAPSQDHQVREISSSPNVESTSQQQGNTTNYDLQVTYDPEQLYDPEKMYDPEESQECEGEEKLDQTDDPNESYDPEQCFRTDEPLDADKMSNSDQTYDPEKALEDDNSMTMDKTFDADKSYDLEKEIQDDISLNTTQNDEPENELYDPAVPYDDDFNEDQDLSKLEDSHTNTEEQQKTNSCDLNNVSGDNLEDGELVKMDDEDVPRNKDVSKSVVKGGVVGGLYSDSEDEGIVKIDNPAFAISDINHMTEDISEEERSYTPCMDEKSHKQGLEGLDTELISDEDRNDFDESHELKAGSDQGDALEINAKESELDLTRPEDYEEGEIVDKNKDQSVLDDDPEVEPGTPQKDDSKESNHSKEIDDKTPTREKNDDKENDSNNKEPSFKRLSKSTKERNYRDKDKDKMKSKEKRLGSSRKSRDRDQRDKKEKRKEKRREIERYNVRALIAEKPRSIIAKDQFGRDIRDTPSRSRSRSYTPPIQRSVDRDGRSPSRERSLSRRRRSLSKEITSRKRRRSPTSRSRSPVKKRSRSKNKKRKRSPGRFKKRRSRERTERTKSKKRVRSQSRNRSRSGSALRRQRDWEKEWTLSPPPMQSRISPSWTPPRVIDNSQVLRNENLTVTLNNTTTGKKKKEKRKKGEKRNKDGLEGRPKKRRNERERTPPPSKEVFASGDNILVSVSFNNENETRDITTREKRKSDDGGKKKKEKKKKTNKRDLTGIKPVAIIDLDRSPFRELTPSPKQVIILSDSDNEESANLRNVQQSICDSSQQVASPEHAVNYSTGPKTPPEPQVKFSLNAKPPQVRAISNPLHDPDDLEPNDQVEEEMLDSRLSPAHKGPNTPPEPPNSPPSSPDAYDPFEPTKSRSPTPDPMQTTDSNIVIDEHRDSLDGRLAIELLEKSTNPQPEVSSKSLTPPLADVQPADSQSSSIHASPDSHIEKSPERPGVVQSVQPSVSVSKPIAQTTPFSSVPTSMITSTPISATLPSRVNILNTTIITPTTVASSIPQRIVLPNQVKSSPVKISPTKAAIKSTPIKPMPSKSVKTARKRAQNGSNDDLILELDSPYSPGSSDYEDLFEPPSEIVTKPVIKGKPKSTTPQKHGSSAFDALFGSPSYKTKNTKDKSKFGKKSYTPSKTKTVGVRVDEDNLKILEDLPNSAVEMQVKDKFLKKLNRQERVVEEVKLVLKPHYNKKRISKEEYKDILRRSVPKICHNKTGEINPTKIKNLIEAYVRKIKHSKKVTSSSSVNPQKV